ncbi:MAG TPA: hypothetical protein VHY08_17685, partial [Bacillota bacterium]|nr:hypothetical protein [Bacillota bacterium]
VYFNDYGNDRIRKIDIHGVISTYAGTGESGFSGDGGPAAKAQINDVYGLAIDKDDNLYFVDSLNFAVRKVSSATGTITTVIGKGIPGEAVEHELVADAFLGGVAHQKGTTGGEVPHGLDVDRFGNLFIADTGINRIRMIDVNQNRLFTIAGTGVRGYSGDGGAALHAKLSIQGLRIDAKGNLYFLDFQHHIIRKITFDIGSSK